MKNLKKLSLEDEINREAEEIEKKVKENKEIEGMTVSEDMETALFNKIQEYEYDKRLKKVVYRKKKRTYVIGAIAAIIILICGSVMTSVGSKSYVKVLWERINGDESSNIINVEDMDSRKTEEVDEGEMYKDFTKTFGDYFVRLGYTPESMKLIRYTIDAEQRKGTLFYQYGDEIIRYSMYLNDDDSSFGQKEVDEQSKEFTVDCEKFIANIKEYTITGADQKRYVADFEYMGIHYQLNGCLQKEELKKILKYYNISMKVLESKQVSHMKNKIIIVLSILLVVILIFVLCSNNNKKTIKTDGIYNINVNGDSSVTIPSKQTKTIFFKINNKSKKDTNYKVGYIGSNVKVTYDSKDSDPLEGTIEKESMKYIKLKIENTSIDATTVTLYSILENSTDTLPEGIKIISEE